MNRVLKVAALALACGAFAPASAQNAMKVCGAKYQAAKTAKTLPAGQTWNQFLSQCRAQMAPAAATTPVGAKPATPVAATATSTTRTTTRTSTAGRAPTPGQLAARTRERACGAQWSAAKAAGKIPAGQKWPQYYSQCNARMK